MTQPKQKRRKPAMTAKRKPKFRVGQVVVLRGQDSVTDYGRHVLRRQWDSGRRMWRYSVAEHVLPKREVSK